MNRNKNLFISKIIEITIVVAMIIFVLNEIFGNGYLNFILNIVISVMGIFDCILLFNCIFNNKHKNHWFCGLILGVSLLLLITVSSLFTCLKYYVPNILMIGTIISILDIVIIINKNKS